MWAVFPVNKQVAQIVLDFKLRLHQNYIHLWLLGQKDNKKNKIMVV